MGAGPQPHMAAIRAADALVEQRWVRQLVVGGLGPAAVVVVGAAAVGEADLQPQVMAPAVLGVAGVAGAAADGQVEVEPGRVDEQVVDQDGVGVGAGHQQIYQHDPGHHVYGPSGPDRHPRLGRWPQGRQWLKEAHGPAWSGQIRTARDAPLGRRPGAHLPGVRRLTTCPPVVNSGPRVVSARNAARSVAASRRLASRRPAEVLIAASPRQAQRLRLSGGTPMATRRLAKKSTSRSSRSTVRWRSPTTSVMVARQVRSHPGCGWVLEPDPHDKGADAGSREVLSVHTRRW